MVLENKELLKQAADFGRKLKTELKEKLILSMFLNVKDMVKDNDVHHFIIYMSDQSYEHDFELPTVIVDILTYDKSLQNDIMYSFMLGLRNEIIIDKEIEAAKNPRKIIYS